MNKKQYFVPGMITGSTWEDVIPVDGGVCFTFNAGKTFSISGLRDDGFVDITLPVKRLYTHMVSEVMEYYLGCKVEIDEQGVSMAKEIAKDVL
jgi:hypothetical protein